MSHTAKILLNCNIEYKNKIIFENKQVSFYADVELTDIEWEGFHIDYFEVQDWHSEDEIARADRAGYLYAVNMNEWVSDDEVENFEDNVPCGDFTLLVKHEDYDDIDVDYGQFEPNY